MDKFILKGEILSNVVFWKFDESGEKKKGAGFVFLSFVFSF